MNKLGRGISEGTWPDSDATCLHLLCVSSHHWDNLNRSWTQDWYMIAIRGISRAKRNINGKQPFVHDTSSWCRHVSWCPKTRISAIRTTDDDVNNMPTTCGDQLYAYNCSYPWKFISISLFPFFITSCPIRDLNAAFFQYSQHNFWNEAANYEHQDDSSNLSTRSPSSPRLYSLALS